MVETIDLVVLGSHLTSLDRVRIDERAKDTVNQDRGTLGHLREMDVAVERRVWRQLDDGLGDRRRMVAHPLEFVRDVIEGQEVPQVARDRVLRRYRHRDLA